MFTLYIYKLAAVCVKLHILLSKSTGGVDYHLGSYHITFPSGSTLAVFNISIINDNIVEKKENFTLSINESSLPFGVMIGKHNQAKVIIKDNDSKYNCYCVH